MYWGVMASGAWRWGEGDVVVISGTAVAEERAGDSRDLSGLSASAVRVSTTGEGLLAGLHRRGVGDSGGVDAILELGCREGKVSGYQSMKGSGERCESCGKRGVSEGQRRWEGACLFFLAGRLRGGACAGVLTASNVWSTHTLVLGPPPFKVPPPSVETGWTGRCRVSHERAL